MQVEEEMELSMNLEHTINITYFFFLFFKIQMVLDSELSGLRKNFEVLEKSVYLRQFA